MADTLHLFHPLKPLYDENSHVLVLGTFPSPKSREAGFYYCHPRKPLLAGYSFRVRRGSTP